MFADFDSFQRFGKYFSHFSAHPITLWHHPIFFKDIKFFLSALRDGALLPCAQRPWHFLNPALFKTFQISRIGKKALSLLQQGPKPHEASILRITHSLRPFSSFYKISVDEGLGHYFQTRHAGTQKPDILLEPKQFGLTPLWIEYERFAHRSLNEYISRIQSLKRYRVIYIVRKEQLYLSQTFSDLRTHSRAQLFTEEEFIAISRFWLRKLKKSALEKSGLHFAC